MPHGKTWFAVCWHDAADLNEYVKSMCRYSHVPALLSTVEDSDHRNTCGVDASQRLPQCLLHAPCMGAGTLEARDPSVPFPWIAYVWPLRGRMQRMQSVCRSQMNTRKKQDSGLLSVHKSNRAISPDVMEGRFELFILHTGKPVIGGAWWHPCTAHGLDETTLSIQPSFPASGQGMYGVGWSSSSVEMKSVNEASPQGPA